MKLIDEKGKVFGKINIIDLVVIIFFISIMVVFIKGFKLMDPPDRLIMENKIRLQIQNEEKDKVKVEMSHILEKNQAWCDGYKSGFADGRKK